MIRDIAGHSRSRSLTLFYGNRNERDAAFLSELKQIARENPGFRLVATMIDAVGWKGEHGFITREMIERYVGDIADPVFYLAGPPAMIAAMATLLETIGARIKNIRAEAFVGY